LSLPQNQKSQVEKIDSQTWPLFSRFILVINASRKIYTFNLHSVNFEVNAKAHAPLQAVAMKPFDTSYGLPSDEIKFNGDPHRR
jgi:hypothetical protein